MYNWDFFENITDYHPIIDANNLYDGFIASRRGSRWKERVQDFRWHCLREINKLQQELIAFQYNKKGAYHLSSYSRFTVIERGKTRAITALCIRDRVVKHVLNDLFLIPHIRPHLIYDNGASLKGKGVSFTRNRLCTHLKKFYQQTGSNDGYILIMDFSGYYDNIQHLEAMKMINKYELDEFAKKLVWQAFDSYKIDVSYMNNEEYKEAIDSKFSMIEYRKEYHLQLGEKYLYKSLSVGDQTSQITAIAFPTPIDDLIKTVYEVKFYARYMDDFYIIAKTKEILLKLKEKIEEKAKELKLIINPRKTKIQKLSSTFTFMQFKYYLRGNGHVVVRINPKTLTRMRMKLKKLAIKVQNRLVHLIRVEEMFRGWICSFLYVMSKKQKQNLIELYQTLFGGGLNEWIKMHNIL